MHSVLKRFLNFLSINKEVSEFFNVSRTQSTVLLLDVILSPSFESNVPLSPSIFDCLKSFIHLFSFNSSSLCSGIIFVVLICIRNDSCHSELPFRTSLMCFTFVFFLFYNFIIFIMDFGSVFYKLSVS